MRNLLQAVCNRVASATHLHSAACTQQPPPISSFLVDSISDLRWSGPYCRDIARSCDGDNPDTTFIFSKPLPLDGGQVYALAGTLATRTGNATFTGVGVNDASKFFAPVNLPDTFGHRFLRGMWIAGIRDYLAPGTARGPADSKLLTPRILEFTKP